LEGTKFGSLNLYSQWIHFGSKINLYNPIDPIETKLFVFYLDTFLYVIILNHLFIDLEGHGPT